MADLSTGLPAPAVTSRLLATDRGPVHYVEAGAGTDDPVLLIHGGHGSWRHWIANIDALAAERRVLALDLPGFGASYDPHQAPDMEQYVAAAAALIDSLRLQRVTLAGFSFGALVATALAAARPHAVSALVLINPPGLGTRSAEALALPAKLSALARAGGLRAGVAGTLAQLMLHDAALSSPALVELIAQCVIETRHVTRMISRQADMAAMLAQAPQKKLLLLGQFDPYQRHHVEDDARWLRQLLGDEAVCIVPDCAHWLQYEQAQPFHQLLLAFTAS